MVLEQTWLIRDPKLLHFNIPWLSGNNFVCTNYYHNLLSLVFHEKKEI
jgi:hypothetical protein